MSEQPQTQIPIEKEKRFFLGVFMTAMLLIYYEMVAFQALIFVSNYMRAIQIIAIALVGISVGGLIAFAQRRRASTQLYSKAAFLIPFAVIAAFVMMCLLPDWPWIYSVFVMLPFVAGTLILSMSFALAPSHKVYFYDLTGAATGAIVACFSVTLLREEGSFLLLAILGFALTILFSTPEIKIFKRSIRKISAAGITILLVLLITNLIFDYWNMTWIVRESQDRSKIFSLWHKKHRPETKRMFRHKVARGSLVERIDFVKVGKSRINVFYNGYGNDHFGPYKVKAYKNDVRLPRGLVKNPDVLVIGTAAEGVVKTAKGLGKGDVVGLEINPAVADLMQTHPWDKRSAYAYKDIELHVLDARSYMKRTDRKFDIVTMMNTHRLRNIGYAGQPEYLHTIEGLQDIFDHLNEDGWLILEERNLSERATLGIRRFVTTARFILKDHVGVKNPANHFWVFRWYGLGIKNMYNTYTQIFIKKSEFNEQDHAFIDQFMTKHTNISKKRKSKKRRNGPENMYVPGEPTTTLVGKLILADDPYQVVDQAIYNFDPITDDRPFPFDVTRERPHLIMLLAPTITMTLLLGLLPSIFLLVWNRYRTKGEESDLPPVGFVFNAASILFFSLLGIGYLLIEVVLIQRLALFIGMPVLAFALVISTMLFFSGLGSHHSRNWTGKKIVAAMVGIVVLNLIVFSVLDLFIESLIFLPVILRALAIVLLLAPMSYLMGTPFPFGIKIVKEKLGDRFGAAMFGLNGAFSALATPLALSIGMIYGFNVAFLLGAATYGLCLLVVNLLLMKRLSV